MPDPTDPMRGDRGDGDASPKDTTRTWRDVMTTSTLPFGASSLPTLSPDCRQELEDRYGRRYPYLPYAYQVRYTGICIINLGIWSVLVFVFPV